MIKNLKNHYQVLLDTHGDSPAAVQHRDKESQYKRFEILTEIDHQAKSFIDIGCGLSDLFDYLLQRGFNGKYLGLDFLSGFIQLSKEKYNAYPNGEFNVFDLDVDKIPRGYEYILLSGVFNNRIINSQDFMLNTIRMMFDSAEKGVAFNAMSTYVDYQDDELYYSNPLEVFDFCKKNITPYIVLKHDYILKAGSVGYEYTMYLFKDAKF